MSARPASNIALIPGDGIGREVTAEAVKVLKAIGGVELHELPWSADHYLQTGETIPADGYGEVIAWNNERSVRAARSCR